MVEYYYIHGPHFQKAEEQEEKIEKLNVKTKSHVI